MFSPLFISMVQMVALYLFILMSILWIISIKIKRVCIIDAVWGAGFVLCTLITLIQRVDHGASLLILHGQLSICVLAWGGRLSWHLAGRVLNKTDEDFRYAAMRSRSKIPFIFKSLWTVFYLQACLMIMIGAPIMIIMSENQPYHWVHFIGLMMWCLGFYLEWEADRSLVKAKKQGIQLMTQGVWSWSRHPNYLGDACVWWGIALMAYGSSYFMIALCSAALMNFFLRKVSGVPLLEKRMASKEGWQAYQAKTPIFWPTPSVILKKLYKN